MYVLMCLSMVSLEPVGFNMSVVYVYTGGHTPMLALVCIEKTEEVSSVLLQPSLPVSLRQDLPLN